MRHVIFLMILVAFPGVAKAKDPRRVRVYVTESQSWQVSGGVFGNDDLILGDTGGGSRPQTVEVIKTFNDKCPGLTMTIKKEKANYIILFDREAKDILRKDNKIAVFNGDGDAIYTGSTRTLGNAVKDACQAIWKAETPPRFP